MRGQHKKYLASKFWTQFFQDFDLTVEPLDRVPKPVGEAVDSQLVLAFKVAHHDNPAQRSAEPFERLVETLREPNFTEFFGMLKASVEGPTMSKTMSVKLRVAILTYVARPCSPVPQTACTLEGFWRFPSHVAINRRLWNDNPTKLSPIIFLRLCYMCFILC